MALLTFKIRKRIQKYTKRKRKKWMNLMKDIVKL